MCLAFGANNRHNDGRKREARIKDAGRWGGEEMQSGRCGRHKEAKEGTERERRGDVKDFD